MHLHLVTGPAAEPVTLAEAKAYRRVSGVDDDTLLNELIPGARQLFEEETGRQVITAAWRLHLDAFPCGAAPIRIPKAPLLAVSSITYVDSAGATQTWPSSEYAVAVYAGPFARPGFIHPAVGYNYPSTYPTPNAVTVNFTAGYGGEAEDVPQLVKAAIKTLLGDLYEERESFITGTIVSPNPTTARVLHRFRVPVYA